MDTIQLNQMQFYGKHGVLPEENRLGQRYVIDLCLNLPLKRAGQSDRLEHTLNYAEVIGTVRGIVEGRTFQLIEALAENIASELLDQYTMVQEITVLVTKPHPPVDIHFSGVTVEITRERE